MSYGLSAGPRSKVWHPFANMAQVNKELVLTRGEGVWLWDLDGRRYLDADASLWYCNVGHGRIELASAAAAQMRDLAAYHTYGDYANAPMVALADELAAVAPIEDPVTFFTVGGSDGIDTAAKIARRYWAAVGEPERTSIVVREHAYHGMNGFGTSLSGIEVNTRGFGDLLPGVIRVPHNDLASLEGVLRAQGSRVAAFFGEPVIGAGGVYPPSDGYWTGVGDLCREHGVLLVTDEVVTGFGRLGTWFGCERYQIQPDLMVCAKGITSGYIPLGAVLCGKRVRAPFFDDDNPVVLRHGYTYSGHPVACAVALANLEIIRNEGLVAQVAQLEPVLEAELKRLAEHPLVGDVRSAGLMAGVDMAEFAIADHPDLADAVAAEARERGVLIRALFGRTLQISPPFVITSSELQQLIDILHDSIEAVKTRRGIPNGPNAKHQEWSHITDYR